MAATKKIQAPKLPTKDSKEERIQKVRELLVDALFDLIVNPPVEKKSSTNK